MEHLQALKKQEFLISNLIIESCLVGTFPFKKKYINSFFVYLYIGTIHLRHQYFLRGGWQKLVKFANG